MIKAVFFGTPEFSQKFLEALNDDGDIFVSAVVAQPDQPVGRKKVMTAPPTIEFAKENGIPYFQPTKLREEDFKKHLQDLEPDVFVIVAYGRIIPLDVLEIPKHGAINVHPSLLPKFRGPSPIQAAISAQQEQTGVSIMLIDELMDHGPLLAQENMTIDGEDDSESMMKKAVEIGAPLLVETIKKHVAGEIEPQPQNHDDATYCRLIKKTDGEIDWNETAEEIEAKSRAYRPWPGIFTTWNGKKLKLLRVTIPTEAMESLEPGQVRIAENRLFIGTTSLTLEVLEIQPEGKSAMNAKAFINGNGEIDGSTLPN